MSIIANQVGIDVSKGTHLISINGAKPFKVPNNEEGAARAIEMIPSGSVVHMEASGGYERLFKRALEEAGIECLVHNARKIERMADGLGRPAKTDALDAQHLCVAGPLVKRPQNKSVEQEQLCDISRGIEALKSSVASYKKRAKKPLVPAPCVESFKKVIAQMEAEIKKLELLLVKQIKQSALAQRHKLASSVTCIGQRAAAVLACELPSDMQHPTVRKLISYAGLAPKDDTSGTRNGPRYIRFGNVHIKRALYMPAITALATQSWAKDLYKRLVAKGRPHQQAIIAVMRKLLERVIVVIRRGTAYTPVPPQRANSIP